VPYGTIGEETETFNVRSFARNIAVTRTLLINDELASLEQIINDAAMGAFVKLQRDTYGILTANAAMADTVALFNAAHANLGTAGALSATTYGELRSLLNKQTGPARAAPNAGGAGLPLPPVNSPVLIYGPDEEANALQLFDASFIPAAISVALPEGYRTSTQLVMSTYLDTGNDPYYLARTEPNMRAVHVAYLRGYRQPQVTSAEDINYLGMTFRCVFDFGVKAATWRTIAANLG
jgi:hypothetical protein